MKYRNITIQKHKTCNTWYARYRKDGKQCYVSAPTQKECYNQLKKALNAITKEIKEESKPKTYTLQEWYNKWLELYKSNNKENTKKSYEKSFDYLQSIKNTQLKNISAIDILTILGKIEFPRRAQMVYELLSMLFETAENHELITKNIMLKIAKPKHKKETGRAISSTDEELFINKLIEKNKDVFLITVFQGLRRGEILGLFGEDLDFENRTITICRALNEFDKLDNPKTEYSTRTIPMFENTYKILLKYKNVKGRIFNYTYAGIGSSFTKFKQKYFPNSKYTIKSLRHTFITKCQEQNIPLHIIQSWVGHIEGSEVTEKVYTHKREKAELECINIVNNIINRNI